MSQQQRHDDSGSWYPSSVGEVFGGGYTPLAEGPLQIEPRWSGWDPSSLGQHAQPPPPLLSSDDWSSPPLHSPAAHDRLGSSVDERATMANERALSPGPKSSPVSIYASSPSSSSLLAAMSLNTTSNDDNDDDDDASNHSTFAGGGDAAAGGFRWRVLHTVLGFFATWLAYMMRVDLSVAVIPISQELGISSANQGLLLGSFYIGYLCFQIIGGLLATRYGAKWLVVLGLVGSSALTLVFPLAVHSLAGMVLLRVFTGVVQAMIYPSMHHLATHWIPKQERCRATMLIWSGANVGTVVAMLVAPVIDKYAGYPTIFYAFGMLSFVWLTPWLLFVSSQPQDHPFVSPAELFVINPKLDLHLADNYHINPDGYQPFAEASDSVDRSIWRVLLSERGVWGLSAVSFAWAWANYLLLGYLPTFFTSRFPSLDEELGSWIAAFCYMTLAVSQLSSSYALDHLLLRYPHRYELLKKVWVSVGMFAAAVLLCVMGFVGRNAAIAAAAISTAALGFSQAGYSANHMDLSPRYAGVLMGFTNTWGSLPGAFGVYLSGWLLQVTGGSWETVFSVAAVVVLLGVVAFWLLGTTRPIARLKDL